MLSAVRASGPVIGNCATRVRAPCSTAVTVSAVTAPVSAAAAAAPHRPATRMAELAVSAPARNVTVVTTPAAGPYKYVAAAPAAAPTASPAHFEAELAALAVVSTAAYTMAAVAMPRAVPAGVNTRTLPCRACCSDSKRSIAPVFLHLPQRVVLRRGKASSFTLRTRRRSASTKRAPHTVEVPTDSRTHLRGLAAQREASAWGSLHSSLGPCLRARRLS
jgi:hypothetical protein